MTTQEAKLQEDRLAKYQLLDAARSALYSTREKMDQKSGAEGTVQSHSDPFTGNARESRRVVSLKIGFSATLGGEAPVDLELNYLGIPAWELGRAIESAIENRLKQINAEIDKL